MPILLLFLLACAEAPTSYAVQHDVGRLCAAWAGCKGHRTCTGYADESGRMMSRWGQSFQPRLAEGEPGTLSELAEMIDASKTASMSASCSSLRASVP